MARGCFSPSAAKFLAGRRGDPLPPMTSPGEASPARAITPPGTPARQPGDPAGAGPPLQPWRLPARGLAVFHGEADTARLSHYFLPRLLLRDRRVLFLDGANSADPRLLERLARQRGADFRRFCRNLQIARAFTCFQLTELIARVPKFRRDFPAEVVLVTAFPELYYDEDIRDADARASFERALLDLARWTSPLTPDPLGATPRGEPAPQGRGARGLIFGSPTSRGPGESPAIFPVAVAVFSTASQAGALPAPARRRFFPRLLAAATEVWRFSLDAEGRLELNCERATIGRQGPVSVAPLARLSGIAKTLP